MATPRVSSTLRLRSRLARARGRAPGSFGFPLSVILVALGVSSCGETDASTSAFELGEARASVVLEFEDALTTTSPLRAAVLQLLPQGRFTTFDDGTAQIGRLPFTEMHLGGESTVPTFRTTQLPSLEASTVFRATDGRSSMEMVIDNLLASRSVALVGNPDGKLRAGTSVTLQWSPPTDALLYAAVVFRPRDAKGPGDSFQARDARVDGSRITFTVPADRAGALVLAVTASATLPVRSCVGVRICDASTGNLTVAVPVELSP